MSEQELPEGWQVIRFGDIAKQISKRIEPSQTDLNIYVGLEHLDPDCLKINRHGVPADVKGQKLLVKKGQIIFGKRRAYQRKVAVANWDCICSAHAMVLEGNSDKVLPDFLPFFMQSKAFMDRAIQISEGSLSPTIKWKVLAEQKFCIPPKHEQKKVIDIGLSLQRSSGISSQVYDSVSQVYETIAKEVVLGGNNYRTLFGKEKTLLPEGWKLVKLGDVLTRVQYGTSDAVHEEGSVPVLRMMNIENGRITNNELKYSKLTVEELEPIKLYPGDLLFNRTNSMEWVGKTGLFNLDGNYVFASYMLRLNVDTDIVTPDFVNRFLNLAVVQYRLKAFATPGVSQANINPDSLKSLPFILPPLKDVKKADRVLAEIETTLEKLELESSINKELLFTVREKLLRN
ncbi:restriction endonuclease subunit S [Vibrio sp. Isolate23]|uniref:restriction endonuclease subunit S n=1 Tax=Vibrio sp. Isolate23 TaxID=2908533 RepID=UPI001EFCAEB0|nr:restriction endonuclease subunit S [Vibrio sp. Isolate23]MCG9683458.1 restriction endonuclease subunit S [Vibrio sp. Isolate23]